jgi:phosphoadenosine phosphosulfate reductase
MEELETISRELESAAPQQILRWAVEEFGEQLVVVTSFQITGIVTMHMLSEFAPQTPIVTLDTGLLFPETYALMDELEARLGMTITRVTPEYTVDGQNERYGTNLWEHEPSMCCYLRKMQPLQSALLNYDAWITGLRRDQSKGRANTPIVSWDNRHDLVKLSPFALWTADMLWTYIDAYDLPYNDLHDQGYPSIGCWPCTQPVSNPDDKRAGRWVGHGKTECGIHLST